MLQINDYMAVPYSVFRKSRDEQQKKYLAANPELANVIAEDYDPRYVMDWIVGLTAEEREKHFTPVLAEILARTGLAPQVLQTILECSEKHQLAILTHEDDIVVHLVQKGQGEVLAAQIATYTAAQQAAILPDRILNQLLLNDATANVAQFMQGNIHRTRLDHMINRPKFFGICRHAFS